jgi:hypothetical protein
VKCFEKKNEIKFQYIELKMNIKESSDFFGFRKRLHSGHSGASRLVPSTTVGFLKKGFLKPPVLKYGGEHKGTRCQKATCRKIPKMAIKIPKTRNPVFPLLYKMKKPIRIYRALEASLKYSNITMVKSFLVTGGCDEHVSEVLQI